MQSFSLEVQIHAQPNSRIYYTLFLWCDIESVQYSIHLTVDGLSNTGRAGVEEGGEEGVREDSRGPNNQAVAGTGLSINIDFI